MPPSASDVAYARVVVEVEPPHLDRLFDYRVPEELAVEVAVGSRVQVTFAGRRRRGLVVALTGTTEVDASRVRPLARVLGPHAWCTPAEIDVLTWAGRRFAAPVADVVRHALPDRTVDVERRAAAAGWFPPGAAPRPADPPAPDTVGWSPYADAGRGLIDAARDGAGAFYWRPLPGEDVGTRLVELAGTTLAAGRDVVVVVPDPASAVADAVAAAFGDLAVDVRGGPSPRVTYQRWLRARCGQARVVVGERGVAFWPVARLGLAVVIDESNPALKERRSPRHHAREVLLERARRAGGVGLLVGTVPSAQAWRLLAARRLATVTPPRALERDGAPLVRVATGEGRARTRLAPVAVQALRAATGRGEYGIVLAARRGEGRALVCARCGTRFRCPSCGSSVARAGARDPRVFCTTCGWQSRGRARCPDCSDTRFVPLAAGAERLGAELDRMLRTTTVAVLEGYAQPPPPPPAVLVMTRGSVLDHPPGPVGAVVLPDLDGQLRRPALDAAEDALRLSMGVARLAVAGRHHAGRGAPGRDRDREALVVVQTDDPQHHAVQALVRWDPGGFWRQEAALRRPLRFPPAAAAVRLDVAGDGAPVADDLAASLPATDEVMGPLVGEGRAQFLVKTDDRVATLTALDPLRRRWSHDGVEVRVDVDPVDVL